MTEAGTTAAETGVDQPGQQPAGAALRRWAGRLASLGRARLVALAAIAAGVAAILGTSLTGGGGRGVPPLVPAKGFSLSTLGHPGRQISLRALAGRPVIVNFFASWCAPCQRETPLLGSFYRARHGRVTIIGIDVNDRSSAALAFLRRSGVTYPVAVEPASNSTVIAYGLPGLPATFFLDSRHRIVKRVYGALTPAELTSGTALIDARTE